MKVHVVPPKGWVKDPDTLAPTWTSPKGATLQYTLESPPPETIGCTHAQHLVWTLGAFARLFHDCKLLDSHSATCAFGVVAYALLERGTETPRHVWYLHDRGELGALVTLLDAKDPADAVAAQAFVASMKTTWE